MIPGLPVANNDGGVRTLFGWGAIDPKYAGKKFILALYSRESQTKKEPSLIETYPILGDWDEQTAWSKQPKVADHPAATYRYDGGKGWRLFDVTSAVAAQMKAAQKSNGVLRALGPDIQWVHSYVAGDKIYCVYNAPSEALIRSHAEKSGFPADKITPVAAVIDPTTANPKR